MKEAFSEAFAGVKIVLGCAVASGVNVQPFGSEETFRGVTNRLAALSALLKGEDIECDYLISVENRIIP